MKVVINKCFGGFQISEAGYEKLISWGIPVRPYINQKRDPVTRLYLPEPANAGEVIFDRDISERGEDISEKLNAAMRQLTGRYWDSWISESGRSHPLVVRLVEEMGEAASGKVSKLTVVEIPDGIEYEIDEYDGMETVHEVHRSWG